MIRLTRQQVREIDRRSIEQYHLPGIVLMENAARAVADVAIEMLGPEAGPVTVLCGGGNNGGDGLAAARHLHNRGIDVAIAFTIDPARYQGEAKTNWEIVEAMRLPTFTADATSLAKSRCPLFLDAIFGTGLTAAPRPPFPDLVLAIEQTKIPVLAIDLPSGLDCDTGRPLGPACIHAVRTVTFVAEKTGFAAPGADEFLGQVTVADIGCPRELVNAIAAASP
jgi:NAD(P)H-hydrate epimerase